MDGPDRDDVFGAPIEFWSLQGDLYHRNPATGRVFLLRIDRAKLAESEADPDDELSGEVATSGEPIDETRLQTITTSASGIIRFVEVPPGVLRGVVAPTPLTERTLDPDIADEVLEAADAIDLHCAAVPLPRPVPAAVDPVIPLAPELVLVALCAEPGKTAKALTDVLVRRGCGASLTAVGSALAKLKGEGKVAATGRGQRGSPLTWKPTERGEAEVANRIRPALLALAAA